MNKPTLDRIYLELAWASNARNYREVQVYDIAQMWIGQGDISDKDEALKRILQIVRLPEVGDE